MLTPEQEEEFHKIKLEAMRREREGLTVLAASKKRRFEDGLSAHKPITAEAQKVLNDLVRQKRFDLELAQFNPRTLNQLPFQKPLRANPFEVKINTSEIYDPRKPRPTIRAKDFPKDTTPIEQSRSPKELTEHELNDEQERLEQLLRDGEMGHADAIRLGKVRRALARLKKLKEDSN